MKEIIDNCIFIQKKVKSNSSNFKKNKVDKLDFNKKLITPTDQRLIIISLLLFIFCIIYLPSLISTSTNISFKKVNFKSEITLRINRIGPQKVMSTLYNGIMPNEIIINGIEQNISKEYNLANQSNIIILKWNISIENCKKMFYQCTEIREIDLSDFDASKVTDMTEMFAYCSSLNFINFSNINTPSLKNLAKIFYYCEALISLDLRGFNTSKVTDMQSLFEECSSLLYLDIASFDTSHVMDMTNMFLGCKKLSTLNLSNFDISNVNSMMSTFENCKLLKSLELKN